MTLTGPHSPTRWITDDELVGQRVVMYVLTGDEEVGVVIAVHHHDNSYIKVRSDDGETLAGNMWDNE